MVDSMIGYSLYFLLAVGLSILLTAAFRRPRGEEPPATPPKEDAAFEARIAAIEQRFGKRHDPDRGEADATD